jgi:hypothetical protein
MLAWVHTLKSNLGKLKMIEKLLTSIIYAIPLSMAALTIITILGWMK